MPTTIAATLRSLLLAFLALTIPQRSDAGIYSCILINSCGTAVSQRASLTICVADFNCDSAVNHFDYLDFIQAFAASDPSADFNRDSIIDLFDYLDFAQALSRGC